jgi:NADP-dependent 3-hydroxy acid dehydrogenase YdfG
VSEEIVGEALQGRRDDIVLATKFFMPMDDRPNHSGGSRKWIIQAVENSLRRLKTDYIDVYQVHRPSPTTDVEETLGALTDLVRQGKIRYIGSSSYSASQIVEAQWASRERNLARFVTEQPPYSILVRGIEEDILPTTQRYGMGTLVYSPLSGGWLTGRWRKDAPGTPTSAARPSARFDIDHAGQPAQARRRRRTRAARRTVRNDIDRPGTRMGDQPPGRHFRDHRPADHGPTRIAAPIGAGHLDHRDPGPHRRARGSRRNAERGGQQLRRSRTDAAGTPAIDTHGADGTTDQQDAKARQEKSVSKRVWLITGAGRGMGTDIAKAALAAGNAVVATGRDPERVAAAIGAHDDVLAVKLDVTSPEDAKAAAQAAVDKFGRIDVLVNNAGNFIAGFFEEISPADFRAQVETNLFGPLNVTRAVLPVMRRQRSGLVIAISSTGGIAGQEFCSAYSASKFGIEVRHRRLDRIADTRGRALRHPHDGRRAWLLPHRSAHARVHQIRRALDQGLRETDHANDHQLEQHER